MSEPNETKEEFIERYEKASGSTGIFERYRVALPCDCDDGGGPTHWAAISRNSLSVRHHLDFDAPKGTPWPEGVERD